MTTAVVLQARLGSTRLPGKVLALVGGHTVLAHCITRLRAHSHLPIIVATTTEPEDDLVAREAQRCDADVLRGPVDDVLRRFAMAVKAYGLEDLIRATADNPAVDLDAPLRTLALLHFTGAHHIVERGLPIGTAVEAVSAKAILQADELATEPYDREHVTPYIRRAPRFRAMDGLAPGHVRAAKLRLTVDTAEDLDFMRRALAAAGDGVAADPLPLSAIIAAARTLEPLTSARRPSKTEIR
jgi:spore coat polysaccharide biosynthesis protein SpsF (cytidylyltransferase family)